METVTERVQASFRKPPQLSDGQLDKHLMSKYLEIYHDHIIPSQVLEAIPSFETIGRVRQKFAADSTYGQPPIGSDANGA